MGDKETNGNVCVERQRTSGSVEDLSEYTDADESVSAPTEFLAEFLTAVMLKEYDTALKYCKLILQYEPENATAKEFYPLILEKLRNEDAEDSDEDDSSESSSSSRSYSSSHSVSSLSKPTDSDATTGSYSSLEDDEPDLQNSDLLGRLAVSEDETNGNTGDDTEWRLTAAFQRKLRLKTPESPILPKQSSDSESPTDTNTQLTLLQQAPSYTF